MRPGRQVQDDKSAPPKDAKAKDTKSKAKAPKDAKPRRSGCAKDAKAKEEKPEGAAAKPHKASGRINAIVIADTDLLADQFWVDVREFLGQQVAIPNASNAAFVVNALDNLSGSDALIALRGPRRRGPALQARQRAAPRRRAALSREGAGADGQAEGSAGPARQAREPRARAAT